MSKPWEQASDEPEAAYARFLVYLYLGPGRSLEKAYQAATGDEAAIKSNKKQWLSGQWAKDCAKHRWTERATAWDIENLVTHGEQAVIAYMASLNVVAAKVLEALTNGKPKDWNAALAVLQYLGTIINPDAAAALYRAKSHGDDGSPKQLNDSAG